MRTSIVILNWNGAEYLQKFLPVLVENTQIPDVEIVIADNASTDDSLSILEKNFPTVRIIALEENYGFASGYNKALWQLKADYFVLLNSDVEVSAGWLQPLLSYMKTHENVAACQPKIRSYNKKEYFEYAGASGGFIDKFGYPFCRGRMLGKTEKDYGQYDDTVNVFWATGACLMIRSEVFFAVNGFDTNFFAHMEEIDLCWRLRGRSYELVCIPQSVVYHVGGGTLNTESPYKTYLNYRNNLLMLYKNLPDNELRKTMFVRYFLDYLSAFHLILTGHFNNAFEIFRARHDYKKMRLEYIDTRRTSRQHITNRKIAEIYSKSIIFQYYFKRKKTYNKLID